MAAYLTHLVPAESVHSLIQARDYTAAHELTGYHEAILALRDIADNVDAANGKQVAQEGGGA
ncbi:hypothetical protein QTI51_09545 [Variovorax sp. J22G73]|uniref:hypothetical protein n=1 Tax=unclassified Variovorax TaxID=663243 RepID=UPI00257526A7|nr:MULTISPECIES: hypothetical protein [unclassified Variovorax]MDM0006457.1 hypothetical protein [Variovorax sp. J22R203]MDM0097520.1 hypothetical protein [Variovorax sp. J22G73]